MYLQTLKTNFLNVHFLHLNGPYYAHFQETSSVGNFGILAFANHLHAQKETYRTAGTGKPKEHNKLNWLVHEGLLYLNFSLAFFTGLRWAGLSG